MLKRKTFDLFYDFKTFIHWLFHRHPKGAFIHRSLTKTPVVLVPGVMQKWNLFRHIAARLAKSGHPVYHVENWPAHYVGIREGAQLARQAIDKNNLTEVILLGHGKGGLMGRYVLTHFNADQRVKKLIAVSTPFADTTPTEKMPLHTHREFMSQPVIQKTLKQHQTINAKIVSIYGQRDNLVGLRHSCALEGANNIQLYTLGHKKTIFQQQTENVILKEIENA